MDSTEQRRLYSVLAGGATLRLLLSSTTLPQLLQHRNELTTPLTSWSRLQEGQHLFYALSQNPYRGGSFHQAPLLLLLPIDSPLVTHLLWTATEVGTAYLVARIAEGRKRELLKGEGEVVWKGWCVAAMYLLHPFAIGTSLARSTIVFSNFFVALAVASALSGSLLSTAFALSLATHLSLYPILLLPPLFLLLRRRNPSLLLLPAFIAHQTITLGLSAYLTQSWDFLGSFYGVILTIPDLTPTIGLGWYFFIEMFDHFRAFFVGVFQLHVFIYVAPLTYAFRADPLFTTVLLVGIISIFKSYPSLGDFALWHALLATYSELYPHLSRPSLLLSLTLYALLLLPTFHHLWLYSGAGNANFFYASTLVWALAQGGLGVGVLEAFERRGVLRGLGEGRGRVRSGKWRVVQR